MSNEPEILEPESDDEEGRQVPEESQLAVLNQSEYLAMCKLAMQYPRSLARFERRLSEYANHSAEIALSMFYSIPRAGKRIIGPSIRFAEIVVPCWGNCAAGTRAMDEGEKTTSSQGLFFDYENRVKISIEVGRRITDKDGRRYNADMIQTTSAAVTSIAYRNACFRGVPRALWWPIYGQAQLTAVGKSKSFAESRDLVLEKLHKLNVTDWMALNSVGAPSIKDIDVEKLVILKTMLDETARGDKTIEELFGSEHDKEIDKLFDQLHYNDTQKRTTREPYMGRAKELLEYLQAKVSPSGSGQAVDISKGKSKSKAKDKVEPEKSAAPEPEPEKAKQSEPEKKEETAPKAKDDEKEDDAPGPMNFKF